MSLEIKSKDPRSELAQWPHNTRDTGFLSVNALKTFEVIVLKDLAVNSPSLSLQAYFNEFFPDFGSHYSISSYTQ